MRLREKRWLWRLYNVITDIPGAGGGSKSMSVAGLTGYARDISRAKPLIQNILMGLGYGDDVESCVKELEEWAELRKRENWA
jgi:hypothetical protein